MRRLAGARAVDRGGPAQAFWGAPLQGTAADQLPPSTLCMFDPCWMIDRRPFVQGSRSSFFINALMKKLIHSLKGLSLISLVKNVDLKLLPCIAGEKKVLNKGGIEQGRLA